MPLSLTDLSFRYPRGSRVFHHLDFSFGDGSTVLLGPNGAGKTTLLSLASSVLWPQAGAVECFGLDPARLRHRREFRRRVTMMPQRTRPIPGLCAREQVAYVGWLKGLSRRAAWKASEDALDLVSLGPQGSTPAKDLSGGQLRRLGIKSGFDRSEIMGALPPKDLAAVDSVLERSKEEQLRWYELRYATLERCVAAGRNRDG